MTEKRCQVRQELVAEPARKRVSRAPLLRKFGNLSSQKNFGSDVIVT